ncbi:hypothetical protein HHI36_000576 [Cryptolaemus montrouzieri]|uniref:Uncharacterized protein n=1 Tax=Cryptolaemus montrouzieri TaxID=559131 RepID=A0ABD2P4Y9_9CUCU
MDIEGLTFTEIYNNIIYSFKKATQEAIGIQEVKWSNKIWWNEEKADSIDMKKEMFNMAALKSRQTSTRVQSSKNEMLPVILAWACVSIVEEFKRLISICMSYSNQFPIIPSNSEEREIKEGLAILCHQAETRMPQFSAAGFFPVDYTMLGMIAGNITAYMIVILQLLQSPSKRSAEVKSYIFSLPRNESL